MKNKKEKLVVILLVVGLIVMTGVISFAAFRFTQTGSVLNQITTGSITMSYTESSNVISMTGALPTTDATGKTRLNEGEYFDFTVGSSITGTANINYEIAAQELDGNTIDGSYIKYYLTSVDSTGNETEVMSPKTYTEETSANEYTGRPANMMSLYQGNMSSSTTVKYRLRLYVDESYNPQGDGGNLIYKVRVNVYGLTGDVIEEALAPGLYDAEGNMTMSWQELIDGKYLFVGPAEIDSGTLSDGELVADTVNSGNYTETAVPILNGTLIIPDSITGFGYGAFQACTNLTNVEIPNSVNCIYTQAFAQCTGLKTITIPNSVTQIKAASFADSNLAIINYNGTIEQWNNITFDGNWNYGCSEITVRCTDGDIIIPAYAE